MSARFGPAGVVCLGAFVFGVAATLAGCEAPPGEVYEFTVFVDEDGNPTTRGVPLADAVVTVDTDGVLETGTTDEEGNVTFYGLVQPFWVTAQHEVAFGSETARFASSRRIQDTTAKAFGIVLIAGGEPDFEPESDPDPATQITGTVANIPAVLDGYRVDVIAKIQGEELGSTTILTGPVPSVTASAPFTLSNLPAGEHALYAAIRQDASGSDHWGVRYQRVAFADSRVQVGFQQSATASIDFEDNAIGFSEQQVTADGWATGGVGPIFDVIVASDELGEVPVGVHGALDDADWIPPSTLFLAASAPEHLVVGNAMGQWSASEDEWWQDKSWPLGTSAPLAYDLIPRVLVDEPLHGARVPLGNDGLDLAWRGGDGSTSLTDLWIEGEPQGLDVDYVGWLVLVPGDTTDLTLPGVDLDMLAPGQYGLEVNSNRSPDATGPLGVEDFSGPDAPEQLQALFPAGFWHDAGQSVAFELE